MPALKTILGQTVASTKEDLHGEVRSRDFLEALIASYPPRMPLHQQHNMQLETIGYIENYRLAADPNEPNHYLVKADVYLTAETLDPSFKGFSISFLEKLSCSTDAPLHYVYLPYPLYNDQDLISELLRDDPELYIGKFVKKQLDPTLIGLIATGVALFLSPEWDIQYKQNVRPTILRLLQWIPNLASRGASADLMLRVVARDGRQVDPLLIPVRGAEQSTLSPDTVEEGIAQAKVFLDSDSKALSVGVRRMKLYYGERSQKYILFHVEYVDGTEGRKA